jgi:hypothetical protein
VYVDPDGHIGIVAIIGLIAAGAMLLTLTSDVAYPSDSPVAQARSKLVGNQVVFEKAFAVTLICTAGILAAPPASGATGTAAVGGVAMTELADGDDDEVRIAQQVGDTVTGAVRSVGNATNGSIQTDLALGRQDYGLEGFAENVGGVQFKQWQALGLYDSGLKGWGQAFRQALSRTSGRIHFNLDGVNVPNALAGDPNTWVGRYTAWELQQIVGNPTWFSRTTFYLNGEALTLTQLAELGIQVAE